MIQRVTVVVVLLVGVKAKRFTLEGERRAQVAEGRIGNE